MPIEMPKGLPFSVDTWTPQSHRKRHHFLTHAHRDHLAGIASRSPYPIYATALTASFALRYFPQVDASAFVAIEVGESVLVKDPDGDFTVTAFDANHCPGAVMFLFEGGFGNLLHTGDCRLTPDCLQYLPMKYITKNGRDILCHLDYLFLDCTFARCPLKIPNKQSAIQQVINCIWKHPNAPVVYLACDMLGQEEILVQVSRTFGAKIYVDKTSNSECFHALSLAAPDILSEDATSRFQVIEGFPRLNERASQKLDEARVNLQPAPLFVRPSAQWYANNDKIEMTQVEKPGLSEAVRDEFGVWHVCYSMHSSREELEGALQLLQPKWVISTTPPCRAMELDYVKKHCYKTRITTDDPLWKLFGVGYGKSASFSSSTASEANSVVVTSVVEASAVSVASDQLQLEEVCANHIELPSSARNLTLFGSARLGLPDADLLQEKKFKPLDVKNEPDSVSFQNDVITDHVSSSQRDSTAESCLEKLVEGVDVERNMSMVSFQKLENAEPTIEKLAEEVHVEREILESGSHIISCSVNRETLEPGSTRISCSVKSSIDNAAAVKTERDVSCIGSSNDLNLGLKKLYRSMNVPVPRPLPSLVELMSGPKRAKLVSESTSGRLNYFYTFQQNTCLHPHENEI